MNSENDIFKYPKNETNGWYTVRPDGTKEWDKKKVKKFWKAIREKGGCDFSGYVFPEFERKFLKDGIFDTKNGDVDFWYKNDSLEFAKGACFIGAKFLEKANFEMVQFIEVTNFENSTFDESGEFSGAKFDDRIYFSHVKFNENICFWHAIFNKDAYFNGVLFTKEANFRDVITHENNLFNFSESQLWEKGNLIFCNFQFREKDKYNVDITKSCQLIFKNINSFSSTIFEGINLSKTSFLGSKIDDTTFIGCQGWRGEKIKEESIEAYRETEEGFCQLKHQFAEASRHQLANDFYAGEMEARRMRLKAEIIEKLENEKYIEAVRTSLEFLIFGFYKVTSCYSQKTWIAFLWIIELWLIGGCLFWGLHFSDWPSKAFLTSLQAISFQKEAEDIRYPEWSTVGRDETPTPSREKDADQGEETARSWIFAILRILSPLFVGLFLLALKNKFKR